MLNPQNLQVFDILLVIIHVCICLGIAFYYYKKIKKADDFSFGLKNSSTIMFVCTIFATGVGAGSTIGYVDQLYHGGAIVLIYVLLQPFFWLITAKFLVPKIYNMQFCSTISQVMRSIYGKSAGFITVIVAVIETIGAISMQSIAIGAMCAYFFGIDFSLGVVLGYFIIAIYGMVGGIRGIMAIDIYQFMIFFLIIPITYAIVSSRFGGVEQIILTLPKSTFKFDFSFTNIIILLSFLTASLLPEIAPPIMHRYLMLATTPKKLKIVFYNLFFISIPFVLSICVIAYIMKANDVGLGENVLFRFISHYVPIGIKAVMIVGLFAIIMSTSDSYLNVASVIITKDFIKVLFPNLTDKQELRILRLFVLIISLVPLFLLSSNLFENLRLFRAFGMQMLIIPLFAGLYDFQARKQSFVFGVLVGFLFATVSVLCFSEYTMLYVPASQIGVAIGFFGCHYSQKLQEFTPKELLKEIKIFFRIKKEELDIELKKYKRISILQNFEQRFIAQNPLYMRFSIFVLCYFFVYCFYLNQNSLSLLILVVVGYILVFMMIFKDVLLSPKLQEKVIPYYYFFTMTFCLPFLASYMLFNTDNHSFWGVNAVLSILLLYQFLNITGFLFSLTAGFTLGYLTNLIINIDNFAFDLKSLIMLIYVYISAIFVTVFFIKNKEKKNNNSGDDKQKELEITEKLGNLIIHEIHTPVAASYGYSQLLGDELKEARNESSEGKGEYKFTKKKISSIEEIVENLVKINLHGLNTLDNLLTILSQSVEKEEKSIFKIKECIYETVMDCELYMPQARDIKIQISDNFKVKCAYNCLKYIIINLIKNTYNHNREDTLIEIRTESDKPSTIYYIEYGKCITEENIRVIFDKFYSDSNSGTGIGLAFCKLVMDDLNGSINCYSSATMNGYTVFTLKFPHLLDE
jgi:Na+/proline symporter/signal transduction histidine kinase